MGSRPMATPGSHFTRQQKLMRFLISTLLHVLMVGRQGRKLMHISLILPLQQKRPWLIGLRRWDIIPLHPSTVALHANAISGAHIGEHWVAQFRRCHPDLKAKWTTGLEKCHAQALNKPAVDDYFEMLEELIEKYEIEKHNIQYG